MLMRFKQYGERLRGFGGLDAGFREDLRLQGHQSSQTGPPSLLDSQQERLESLFAKVKPLTLTRHFCLVLRFHKVRKMLRLPGHQRINPFAALKHVESQPVLACYPI